MTLVANIKGYINNKEWGIVELKTYEEILDMATNEGYPRTNTVTELNRHKDAYLNYLLEGGHLDSNVRMTSGVYTYAIKNISYNNGTSTYRIFSPSSRGRQWINHYVYEM